LRGKSDILFGMPFPRSLDRVRPAWASEEEREWPRRLREQQTEAEAALWQLLRDRKLIGSKFRRQVPIGRYVADFYCHERKLIVELDGGIHSDPDQQLHDQSRDTFLLSLGLRVLRIPNEELLNTPEKVLDKVRKALVSR
jgi:very-short-patch-repair endonuclease